MLFVSSPITFLASFFSQAYSCSIHSINATEPFTQVTSLTFGMVRIGALLDTVLKWLVEKNVLQVRFCKIPRESQYIRELSSYAQTIASLLTMN
jgi:hypothetical protein